MTSYSSSSSRSKGRSQSIHKGLTQLRVLIDTKIGQKRPFDVDTHALGCAEVSSSARGNNRIAELVEVALHRRAFTMSKRLHNLDYHSLHRPACITFQEPPASQTLALHKVFKLTLVLLMPSR